MYTHIYMCIYIYMLINYSIHDLVHQFYTDLRGLQSVVKANIWNQVGFCFRKFRGSDMN